MTSPVFMAHPSPFVFPHPQYPIHVPHVLSPPVVFNPTVPQFAPFVTLGNLIPPENLIWPPANLNEVRPPVLAGFCDLPA
ncbi:hypothetical protein DNTS_025177 [Danionella cerebrum]|uniref:Uncharacterized protein n=1 Tax=Danionella cerebrum TaxID=2873325 RepID=A0A553QCB4_9TELE|nr:hypothetical protein DNTS_025177 [Danionella translucida]